MSAKNPGPQPKNRLGQPIDEAIARDLNDLRGETERNLPVLSHAVRGLKPRAQQPEGRFSKMMKRKKSTPWLVTAAVAVVVLALTVVPISYSKTVSHDVALSVSGNGLDMDGVGVIAKQLKSQLGAEGVTVKAMNTNGEMAYTLEANVPVGSGKNPSVVANAFANTLTADGYSVSAEVTPIVEKVSGSVYAMAMSREIRISIDDKSDAELEAEIRQALLDAGASSASVSVRSLGDDSREIKVEMERESEDPNDSPDEVSLILTKDGEDLIGGNAESENVSCRQMIKETDEGSRTVVVEVSTGSGTVTAEVTGAESLDDASLAAEVESQLRGQGLDVTCTASDGRVKVNFN